MSEDTLIAVVEDDPEIRALVSALLSREGFKVQPCTDGRDLDRTLERQRVDLVILDIMMPGEDGLSICRRLRVRGDTAVLMVSAKADDIDRVVGLELGADDYLPKPFNPRELVARVRAILRRTRDANSALGRDSTQTAYRFAGWRLDAGRRELVSPSGTAVALTGGEYYLLLAFVQHPQRVLNRDQLLDWTRGRSATPYDRAIDVQVSRLRKRLGGGGPTAVIQTVRSGGYLFTLPVEREG
ncbi:MAG: response regulator [Caulobacteraceae bacterium]